MQSEASRSGNVTTGATLTLVAFGVPQATLDAANGVRVYNHATANRLIYTVGPPASPAGTPAKREVLGVGLIEDVQADTPVGTASSEHGEILLPGASVTIMGRVDIRRFTMIAQTGTCRVTVTPIS